MHERDVAQLPSARGSRALLKAQLTAAQLTALASASPPGAWHRGLAYAGAAVLCAALGLVAIHQIVVRHEPAPEFSVPRTGITPGAIRPLTKDDVCAAQTDDRLQMIPVAVKTQVFQE